MTGAERARTAGGRGPSLSRGRAASVGALTAIAALAASELSASLLPGAGPGILDSLGRAIIDAAPQSVVEATIVLLGPLDKPVLVVAVLSLVVLSGVCVGFAARRRRWLAGVSLGVLGAGDLALALHQSGRSVPSAIAGAALVVLAASATARTLVGAGRDSHAQAVVAAQHRTEVLSRNASDRRTFLAMAGWVAGIAVVGGATGRFVLAGVRAAAARGRVHLPTSRVPAAIPAGASLSIAGISPLITPSDDFYRVDTALWVPGVDPTAWSLQVGGMVDRPYELSFEELLSMPMREEIVTICCVSNEVGGPLLGTARWLGVPLTVLLQRAGVQAHATQLLGRSVDGFTAGFPATMAVDGRTALVAVGMNREPLPLAHGFPARLVVAGLYGYTSAVKWLTSLHLTTFEAFDPYWVERGWSRSGIIRTESRIDVPPPYAELPRGQITVAGVAWAPARGVARVEVQVDDGPWAETILAPAVSSETWRQWWYRWEASSGRHLLRVRATDGLGQVQDSTLRSPFPDGATGLHVVAVRVR